MNVRQPENPLPPDEPAPGYFAPPPELVVGQEWRLIQPLRNAALTMNATSILTEAVVAQCQYHLSGSSRNLGMAFADLAVTGRTAYQDFVALKPQDGGPIQAAATARLATLGTPGVTPQLVLRAESEVLDRAYQVAWFLRAQTPRGNLGWIAVSGEDDLPHRPVNVPRTNFPQCDLFFTVNGGLGAVVVQTRYAIATATEPGPTPVSLPKRSLPPVANPALPPNDRIILFIHGSDSPRRGERHHPQARSDARRSTQRVHRDFDGHAGLWLCEPDRSHRGRALDCSNPSHLAAPSGGSRVGDDLAPALLGTIPRRLRGDAGVTARSASGVADCSGHGRKSRREPGPAAGATL